MNDITFRPLTREDFPLMHRWLNNDTVAAFYGVGDDNHKYPTFEEVVEEYDADIGTNGASEGFLVLLSGRPVSYIQTYAVSAYPEYAAAIDMADEDPWAIDIFIGEDDARGIGLGPRIIEQFVQEHVFSRPGVNVALLNPEPENERGRRSYEKAGFRHVKTVWIPESSSHEFVMRRDRE
ncbi:MAG TPA: GNAT family N-acetyltransferase [Dehalococcoidia bacterium]|nr:GNAT family N-acetyltransferase [Dehalococcoidia bacterium]